MKNLPNINKSVPEATDPALIKPVSDAIEAVDQAIGAKPSTLATTAKTIVPAVNELKGRVDTVEANSSLLTMTNTYEGSQSTVQTNLDTHSSSFPGNTWYRLTVYMNTSHPQLGDGAYYIEGFKRSNDYEWQTAKRHELLGGIRYYARTKGQGTWGAWQAI